MQYDDDAKRRWSSSKYGKFKLDYDFQSLLQTMLSKHTRSHKTRRRQRRTREDDRRFKVRFEKNLRECSLCAGLCMRVRSFIFVHCETAFTVRRTYYVVRYIYICKTCNVYERTRKRVCACTILCVVNATHSECDTRWISVLLKLKQCFYFLHIYFQMSTMITRNRPFLCLTFHVCAYTYAAFIRSSFVISCEWANH